MATNLGKMEIKQVAMPSGAVIGVPYAAGTNTLWRDHAPDNPGNIYLVVRDGDGFIVSAGPDPSWNLIAGYDIWEVAGSDYAAAYGKTWDGENIV